MSWGGISYFLKKFPIFIDEWLELIEPQDDDCHTKMYFTGDRYAKFV